MKRRIISMALALSLLIGAAVRPQRANAVAVTATVVAASAAAILTACGVSYWAATQTDAVDYITGKLEDYLSSIEVEETPADWLGISATAQPFTVIAGGALRFSSAVANKLLGFARWFQQEEGLESGGEAIGILGENMQYIIYNSNNEGSASMSLQSTNGIRITFDSFGPVGQFPNAGVFSARLRPLLSGNYNITIVDKSIQSDSGLSAESERARFRWGTILYARSDLEPTGLSVNNYVDINSESGIASYNKDNTDILLVFRASYNLDGYVDIVMSDANDAPLQTESTVIVTPSAMVNIPSDIAEDSTFDLITSANITSNDDTDTASEAIIDEITAEEGLTSNVNDTSDTSWGWLYTLLVNIGEAITDGVADIKQAVLGLADSIYSKFTAVLQDIKAGVAMLKQDVVSALGEVKQAVIGIPSKIDDAKQVIIGLPSRIAEAVRGLFVPVDGWAASFVGSLYNAFADRVGVLTYPLAVAESFLMRFLTESVGDPVVSWGTVREPFSQQILIQAGSYNFNSMLEDQQIARVYGILQLVLKAGMAFTLFELCRKKYNTIIHGGAS